MAHAMALSAAGDCVLPPVTPSSRVKAAPEPEPELSPIERYSWTRVVREWLAEERRHDEYLEMLERDTKEEQRKAEEEARQAAAAHAVAQLVATQPAPDMNAL
ncbi:hypothetical protein D1007_02901 [Hordeum vulgare]|nr:hypothetical protein D1007_02901 [Hordeum vulgare]